MNEKTKYIAGIQLYLENQLMNYTPRVISSLSKEGYDIYITKKNTIDKITKLLNEPDFNKEKFKNIIDEKLNIAEKAILSPISTSEKAKLELKLEIYKEILSV